MYNISQLNDLLVPELLDIAEQFNIPNSKKMNKQDLVESILEKQSLMADEKKNSDGEKPKRKRIIKGATDNEPATPSKEDAQKKELAAHKAKKSEPEKKPVKRPKLESMEEDDEEELQPLTAEDSSIPAAIAQMLQEEDIQQPEVNMDEPERPGKEIVHSGVKFDLAPGTRR